MNETTPIATETTTPLPGTDDEDMVAELPTREAPAMAAAHPAPSQSACIPQDLECRAQRIAAQDHHPRASRKALRFVCAFRRRPRDRLGDALRQSFHRVAIGRPR